MRAATLAAATRSMSHAAQRIGRVSSEWFSRPDDERFLSLGDLARSVRGRSERSRTRVVESALIHVEANRNDPERLALILPGADAPVTPTHWSFGQLASQVGAPAAYLRQLPAPLAAINLQYGLTSHRAEQIKTLETDNGRLELRAVTGPDYGRIYDHELVEAVQKIAGNGTGDTRWKVPGVLDWSTGVYNPRVDITKRHDHALRLGPRRVPVPGRRSQPDRSRPIARRIARSLLPGLLLLELRSWREDARHGELLPARRLPEPEPLGRRGLRGNQHPPQQICREPLCPRSSSRAGRLRQLLAPTLR
jgi:hypothetical protein